MVWNRGAGAAGGWSDGRMEVKAKRFDLGRFKGKAVFGIVVVTTVLWKRCLSVLMLRCLSVVVIVVCVGIMVDPVWLSLLCLQVEPEELEQAVVVDHCSSGQGRASGMVRWKPIEVFKWENER